MQERGDRMSKVFTRLLVFIVFSICLTLFFWCNYQQTGKDIFLILFITFLTISYHFLMRVIVGETVTKIYEKRDFRYDSFWWKSHDFEQKIYRILCVKKWKLHMITAKPEQFDIRKRTVEELLHNMVQAELVHEINMVLSFLPIVLIYWFGAATVFIITSICACLMDYIFVIMQRYNRPRVMKLLRKRRKKARV